jgi:sugar-specific transcriptional regulator TrmB
MIDQLKQLGFSEKEIKVYLALLEFGTQPASVIAKKVSMPRPTVLFLFDQLAQRGLMRKSRRGRVQYFFVELNDLKKKISQEISDKKVALESALPLLDEFKNPFTSQPKVTFFEGVDGCKKAYSLVLESTTEVLEFAAHEDLERMGVEFMNDFVRERTKRKVFLKAISKRSPLNVAFKKLDKKEQRHIKMYPKDLGTMYSSIDVFEDKVLLLNLHHDAFAILIENKAVAETLKTIHTLVWKDL